MNELLSLHAAGEESGDNLSFLAFPAKKAADQVSGTTETMFGVIRSIVDQIFRQLADVKTGEEFQTIRTRVMGRYYQVMLALGKLISAEVPRTTINQLTYESLAEMEGEFLEYGQTILGEALRDQAIFTVWTLKRINGVGKKLHSCPDDVADELLQQDITNSYSFVGHVLAARFHLDYLLFALRNRRAVYPEVAELASEGLLSLVNAYAYLRQSVLHRSPAAEEDLINIEFDDEEAELLGSSMQDLAGA